jgi:TolA-binding protein
MTRFDLHPEELLERAERGSISAADRARLDQHLAECAVCRVERGLSARAAIDSAPLRDEQLLLARLKRDVIARLESPSGQRPRRKRAVVVLSLLAASIASVATATTIVVMRRAASVQETVVAPRGAEKPATAPRVATPTPAVAPTPVVEEPKAIETTEVTPSVAGPDPEQPAKAAPIDVSSAAEAFSRANQARRDGKVKEAVRLYRTLQERFAGSSEELVSRVALGRLLLDRLGDSRGALVQFNSYLASPGSGALREEAMVGRALALGRLGRSAEERAAWTALLDAWPKSAHAKRAQARLAELGDKASAAPR